MGQQAVLESYGTDAPTAPAAYAVDTRKVAQAAWSLSLAVIALGLLRALHTLVDPAPRFTAILDFGREQTIPAWFSATLMMAAAALLAVLAVLAGRGNRRDVASWAALSAIFVYLSLDEAISLHERTIEPTIALLGLPQHLHYYAWLIAYTPPLLAFLMFVLPLLARLPRRFAGRMVLAGLVFVGGAFGMEGVGGLVFNTIGEGPVYLLCICAEEILEICGMTLFVVTLVDLVAFTAPQITLRFERSVR